MKTTLDALTLAKLAIEAHVEYCQGREDYELFTAACFTLDRLNYEIAILEGKL